MPFDPSLLKPLYHDDPQSPERVGFVVDGEIVEVENISSDPVNGFQVAGADLLRYAETATDTWHTHPGQPSNLTVEDYRSFLQYHRLRHHIVGNDGVSTFYVENGKVLSEADNLLSRPTQGAGAGTD